MNDEQYIAELRKEQAKAKYLSGLDLTSWYLHSTAELDNISLGDIVRRAAAEALVVAMREKASVSFPIEWNFGDNPEDGRGRPAVFDPDVIYFSAPIGFLEYDDAEWSASLRECIESFVSGTSNKGKIAGIHVPSAESLRDHLRAMSDLIDAALKGRDEPQGKSDEQEKT